MLYLIRIKSEDRDDLYLREHYFSCLELYKTIVNVYLQSGVIHNLVVQMIRIENNSCMQFFSQNELINFIRNIYIKNNDYSIVREKQFIANQKGCYNE